MVNDRVGVGGWVVRFLEMPFVFRRFVGGCRDGLGMTRVMGVQVHGTLVLGLCQGASAGAGRFSYRLRQQGTRTTNTDVATWVGCSSACTCSELLVSYLLLFLRPT